MNKETIESIKFSVAMSVYKKDSPDQLNDALKSICEQSCVPSEIFIVVDGPITKELNDVLNNYSSTYSGLFTFERLEKNGGLGNALKIAVEKCKYDIIARMDSDDISAPDRFKKQIQAFIKYKPDVLGGWTIGFFGNFEDKKFSAFRPPLDHQDICKRIAKRTPISHVTAMFDRNVVIRAGNYQDLFYHEDYYLWARMIHAGFQFMNIPEYLVYVRCGESSAARHGGLKYFKAERILRKYLLHARLCSLFGYIKQIFARFIYEIVLPPKLRVFVDKKIKRKLLSKEEINEIFK